MKRVFGVLILSLISFSVIAGERAKVDKSRPVASDGFVSVQVTRGDLLIEGWDRSEVHVTGWLDEEALDFIFSVDGNQTEIAVKMPRQMSNWSHGGESELTVHVPVGSNVEVRCISTDTEMRNLAAGIKMNNVSGEVKVSHVSEGVNLTTISGDIQLHTISGRVHVRTVSGDIESIDVVDAASYESVSGDMSVKGSGRELTMETVSGELVINTDELSELSGHTVSGDIDVSANLAAGGRMDLRSTSGRLALNLPAATSARFDLETSSGGQIRNRLTNDEAKQSKYSQDSVLRFVMGEGNGDVTMSTTSGRIILDRQ